MHNTYTQLLNEINIGKYYTNIDTPTFYSLQTYFSKLVNFETVHIVSNPKIKMAHLYTRIYQQKLEQLQFCQQQRSQE